MKTKKWMLEDMIAANGNAYLVLNIVLQFIINSDLIDGALQNVIGTFLISFAIVLLFLLFHVMVNVIPPKAEELLAETYPEYKMVE